jgi:phosphatidyl-myo-inositol alpha-mannosyltransferase
MRNDSSEPGHVPPADSRRAVERPLRICLVSQSYLPYHGGITEHVWHLADALARRGHGVSILTGAALSNGHAAEPDPPGVRVIRLGRTLQVPSHGGRACVVLGRDLSRQIVRHLPAAPDLVHVQSPLEPFLPLWAVRHLPGVKVGTFHTGGSRPHWGYRGFSAWLAPYARRLAQRIAVSREAARFVSAHFPGSYEVIPNGVDLARFADARMSPIRPGGRIVLYVGRLDPRKGLRLLLAALERVRSGRRDAAIELWLAGEGPEAGWLARQAAARRLPVRLLGRVARADLPAVYARADLFVAPATDGESFGINLLEAMASGTPIVAARIAGYAETLGEPSAARLFHPGDVVDLAAGIATLLADDAARARLRAAGRRRVEAFAWERIVGRIEHAYRAALEHADALTGGGGAPRS